MTAEFFKYILILSLIGTALSMLITLLKPITKKVFGYSWHYYIWLAVLIVMILPVRFTIPDTEKIRPDTQTTVQMQAQPPEKTQIPADAPDISVSYHYKNQTPVQKTTPAADLVKNNLNILITIWLLGVLAVLSVSFTGYFRLLRKIHKHSYVISCPEIRKYTKRNVCVRIGSNLSSPFIIGIFRPTLILPDMELTAQQLDNILMHEATHLNRNDILYKWFSVFVKALHWFNPAVYYVTKQINTECEISCDMSVVRNMDSVQTTDYVNTILSLISAGKGKVIPLTTGMTGNKNTLKQRFATIKNKFFVNKKAITISVASAILVFAFAICISGFLGGKWIKSYDNSTIQLSTDDRNDSTFNALFIGVDEQDRADSLMLLKFTETSLEGFSIPRNAIFGGKTASQILAQESGDQKVIDAIRSELSVPITYYAKIKIDLIRDLIDATGGLTVDIPMDMKYDDPYKNLHIDLKKGSSQHLNGEQICGLLQFRRSNDGSGYAEGDLERIRIGQQVLTAFFSQNKLNELVLSSKDIIDSINKNVVTNYSVKNFINDRQLLSGKNIAFYTLPGKVAEDNGILSYEIDSSQLNAMLSYPAVSDTPLKKVSDSNNTVSFENTPLIPVHSQAAETKSTVFVNNASEENLRPQPVEKPESLGSNPVKQLNFSSISDAEQYLQSGGITAADNKSFKSGSNYMINDYSFKNTQNEKISSIACDDNGELSIYFNGNSDTLMSVSFTDSETKDEVNSAIILTGADRIYKFTGLDPARNYDMELTDLTEGDWKIEGKYIIF